MNLVGQPQRRNPTSSTELVANIADTESSDLVALCTLDGWWVCAPILDCFYLVFTLTSYKLCSVCRITVMH